MKRGAVALSASLLLWSGALTAHAQPGTPAPSASPTESATSTSTSSETVAAPEPTPTALGVSEIATKLTQTQDQVREWRLSYSGDGTLATAETNTDSLDTELKQADTAIHVLENEPAGVEAYNQAEDSWEELQTRAQGLLDPLSADAKARDKVLDQVGELVTFWGMLPEEALGDDPMIKAQVEKALSDLVDLQNDMTRSRSEMLRLLTRLSTDASHIKATLSEVRELRRKRSEQVLVQRLPALWEVRALPDWRNTTPGKTMTSLTDQVRALLLYASNHSDRFLLHLLAVLCLGLSLAWARRRVQPWADSEPALQRAWQAFKSPLVTSLLLTVFLSRGLYPDAPPILRSLLGVTALLPAALLLSRLLDTILHPLLRTLVALFLIDRIRVLVESQPLLQRFVFVSEMVLALLFVAWVWVKTRKDPASNEHLRLRLLLWSGAGVLLVALICSVLGYVELGYFLGDAVLHASYLALFYAAIQGVLIGLSVFVLRSPPFSLMASVRDHRPAWRRGISWCTGAVAIFFWSLSVLNSLQLQHPAEHLLTRFMESSLRLGTVRTTVGGVAGLLLTMAIVVGLSRLLRFVLEQDLYPRLHLNRGVTYTLSTQVHYLLLGLGVLIGLSALGVDVSKLALVAGALSVGIGLGLQNLVNNFVSGLVLLFERPVKVGDIVQVADQAGSLQRIGLRASVLQTLEGSEVIVPNGELLSKSVTNWTLSNTRRRMLMNVGVAYGTDPDEVTEILLKIAQEHEDVLVAPAPDVLFLNFGDNSLDFQLRAWTERWDTWQAIRSDLMKAILRDLTAAGIEIPFPQRSVSITSWPVAGTPTPQPPIE